MSIIQDNEQIIDIEKARPIKTPLELKIKCVNTTTDSDGAVYGKFVIEPLERGYGTTLGNALRRILLSSIEGAAVTAVRIEGITHEFTTIPGVVEDVVDIILNFKGLVVKSENDGPQHLRLDVDKAGPVLASNIEVPAGVKIINSDWQLCTIDESGSIHADLTVERGTGYIPYSILKNLHHGVSAEAFGDAPIDVLPIDAAFMPIRRVSYSVENTRVGEKTDYDKLIMEIWSNGSIDVTAALSEAAGNLIDHLVPIVSLTGQATVTMPTVVQESKPEPTSPKITIEELELSVRAYNCLKRANINSLEELLQKSEHDLLNIKNFGKKSSDEVIERLHAFGLSLAPNPEDIDIDDSNY